MAFDRFTQRQFEAFLGVLPDGSPSRRGGFYRVPISGTQEMVYSRRVGSDLCLRIYSTVEGGIARLKDLDAIRITVFWMPTDERWAAMIRDGVVPEWAGRPILVGGEAKVLRVPTWRDNLGERLKNYQQIIPPRCRCGCPKIYKKPNKRRGQTWKPFWGCVLYKRCPIRIAASPPSARHACSWE